MYNPIIKKFGREMQMSCFFSSPIFRQGLPYKRGWFPFIYRMYRKPFLRLHLKKRQLPCRKLPFVHLNMKVQILRLLSIVLTVILIVVLVVLIVRLAVVLVCVSPIFVFKHSLDFLHCIWCHIQNPLH